MAKNNLYFGGVPTDIEIKALGEKWPGNELKHGEVLTHEDIAAAIKCEIRSNRYVGVMTRWRKFLMRDHSVVLKAFPDGFRVMNDNEKVGATVGKIDMARRAARRGYKIASTVDVNALSDENKRLYEHGVRCVAAVMLTARVGAKALLPEMTE